MASYYWGEKQLAVEREQHNESERIKIVTLIKMKQWGMLLGRLDKKLYRIPARVWLGLMAGMYVLGNV